MENQTTQVERLIELAIIQRAELKRVVDQLPQLREHLSAEVERTFEEVEPQLRVELEEFVSKQAEDKTTKLSAQLEQKIAALAKTLQDSAQAKFSAIIAARDQNADLLKQAEQKIAEAAASIPSNVKEIVAAELSRFPRAGEIDQLRKEFAEPRGLNPRGKWASGETYNRLDLVSYNGDSFVSSVDGNTDKPKRDGGNWTLSAARGTSYGGGGGITSLIDLYNKPNAGQVLIGTGKDYTNANITAGDGIAITNGVGSITISASGGVNYQGTWNASTNTPTLTSSVGTKGYYYVVAVAGSTNLNGITDWQVGDWAIFNGTAWQKVDTTDQVTSVFGRQGAVVAVNTDYSSAGIDNTAIGATTPSTGAFTTLTTTSNIVPSGSLHAANGSAANPSIAFVNSQTTGLYRQGANIIGLAVAGTNVGNLSSTGLSLAGNLTVSGSTNLATGQYVKLGTSFFAVQDNTSGTNYLFSGGAGGTIFRNGNDTATIATLTNGGNLTAAGNLTVSGTGNSSFAGNLLVTNSKFSFWDTGDQATYGYFEAGHFTNGTFIGTVAGSNTASDLLRFGTTNTERMRLNSSGNLLLGTTTDAGAKLSVVGNLAAYVSGGSQLYLGSGEFNNSSYYNSAPGIGAVNAPVYGVAGSLAFYTYGGATNARTEVGRFVASSGNLLLKSDGVDSSNGRLQLATHTTSAGGIGFGTVASLYADGNNGYIALAPPSGTSAGYRLYNSTTLRGQLAYSGTDVYLDASTGSLIFRTGSSTNALTLDSSQNATFAGAITGKQTIAFPNTANAVTIPNGISLASGYSVGYLSFYNGSGGKVDAYVTSNNLIISDNVRMAGLPTSSTGLASGQLWIDVAAGRVIKVVA